VLVITRKHKTVSWKVEATEKQNHSLLKIVCCQHRTKVCVSFRGFSRFDLAVSDSAEPSFEPRAGDCAGARCVTTPMRGAGAVPWVSFQDLLTLVLYSVKLYYQCKAGEVTARVIRKHGWVILLSTSLKGSPLRFQKLVSLRLCEFQSFREYLRRSCCVELQKCARGPIRFSIAFN